MKFLKGIPFFALIILIFSSAFTTGIEDYDEELVAV
jgi:hypothetical protein